MNRFIRSPVSKFAPIRFPPHFRLFSDQPPKNPYSPPTDSDHPPAPTNPPSHSSTTPPPASKLVRKLERMRKRINQTADSLDTYSREASERIERIRKAEGYLNDVARVAGSGVNLYRSHMDEIKRIWFSRTGVKLGGGKGNPPPPPPPFEMPKSDYSVLLDKVNEIIGYWKKYYGEGVESKEKTDSRPKTAESEKGPAELGESGPELGESGPELGESGPELEDGSEKGPAKSGESKGGSGPELEKGPAELGESKGGSGPELEAGLEKGPAELGESKGGSGLELEAGSENGCEEGWSDHED